MSLSRLRPAQQGSPSARLADWATRAASGQDRSPSALPAMLDEAARRIPATWNLMHAWRACAQNSGDAAGPDGRSFCDFTRVEKWQEIERLRNELLDGSYRHGPVRNVQIPKRPGSTETRQLGIPNVVDRVAGRAIVQIVEPLMQFRFDDRSFCRGRRGAGLAVACARQIAAAESRWTWICQDFRQAFDRLPLGRLLEVVGTYFPSPPIQHIIQHSVGDDRDFGLLQGAPLSPFLMNLYLHDTIDCPWRSQHPSVPLLRYMDDVVVMCQDGDPIHALHDDLAKLAADAAMELKFAKSEAICNLGIKSAKWLGFVLRREQYELQIRLPFVGTSLAAMQSRESLNVRFQELHHQSNPLAAADDLIAGIINWAAPTLSASNPREVYEIIRKAARAGAFEEIISFRAFLQKWQKSYADWQQRCVVAAEHAAQVDEIESAYDQAAYGDDAVPF